MVKSPSREAAIESKKAEARGRGTGGRCEPTRRPGGAVTVSNIERYDTAAKKSARGSAQLPPATQQQATPNKNLSTTSSTC